jgi:thiol-disulfide isomerase/thioredoxin
MQGDTNFKTPKNMKKQCVFIVFVLIASNFFAQNLPTSEELVRNAEKKIGTFAPNFTQKDINGDVVTLEQFRGKYVLLNFWASWCVPCRRSHPHLMELINKYKNDHIQFIGFSGDGDRDTWVEAIEKDKLSSTIHINLFEKFNDENVRMLYNIYVFPTKILIDPEGKILKINLGTHQDGKGDEFKEFDEILERAFVK